MAVNIEGKVVVITGASSGLGESTARLLAASGAKVALGARRKDRIDALVKDITAKGGSAIGFKTDVTKRSDVEALVKGAMDKYGRIDVIVAVHRRLAAAPSALVAATLEDALALRQRPNLPGTIDERPNWSLTLPVPLADVFTDPLVAQVVAALER